MSEITLPTPEDVEALINAVLSERDIELSPIQKIKFQQACQKTILENENATSQELKIAARIYLNFILDFPDLSF